LQLCKSLSSEIDQYSRGKVVAANHMQRSIKAEKNLHF